MIDYKQIVADLSVEKIKELLYKLGAELIIEKKDCLVTNTICHNIENGSMKLYYYYNSHMFYCYSSCQGMSIFKFLKTYYETRKINYDWYEDIFKVIIDCSNYNSSLSSNKVIYNSLKDKYYKRKTRKELEAAPDKILDVFTKKYPVEWEEDGISHKAMDKYNILFSISQNKIIIPHYDVNNRLIGIRGRALDKWEIENVGKYMPVQIENKWYSHPLSFNLYGLNMNKDNIKKMGICYIFEAEKSVLQLENFMIPNCAVAVCGSQLNKYQVDILLINCAPREIVICFDNEEEANSDEYFNKLWNLCNKYKNYANFSFIYDREQLTKLKDSPSDRGQEVFIKLLEGRIKVK